MKNLFPVIWIFGLFIILAYGFITILPKGLPPSQPEEVPQTCKEGQTQYCSIGNCSGFSTCKGGLWSGCFWERVCEPGSRASCLKNGCVYAIKECNRCGTGYGPCTG